MKNYNLFFEKLNLEYFYEFKQINDVFTCELKLKDIPFISFGKGGTPDLALLSAQGEMAERILTRNFFEEYYVNNLYPDVKEGEFLNKELKHFYKIDSLQKEELIDFNSDSFEILSIPFLNRDTKEKVYFPINLIQNLYASNGMAAHFDIIEAYKNAKAEIIERFVKFEVIKYALPLPKIDHPLNSKNIQIYDSSLGGKYPVMAASYIEDDNIILAFGCDINQEKAIKKAYFELLQSGLNNFGKIIEDIEDVRDRFNLINHFIDLSGNVHKNFLKRPLFEVCKWNFANYDVFNKKEYFKIYKCCGIFALQVIIPGISEIYPIEDLIYNNINYPKFFRDKILNYQNYEKQEINDLIEEISLLYPFTQIDSLIGIIAKEPLFIDRFKEIIKNNQKIEFSDKYLNILKLSQILKEKNEV
ncbi:ribosomal protein S12 methylthiotransferase accessory factor [Lebetimonas natsushimae]|uniref:Ribosomal protein S12 methylthiotransferase accessory factor n=1 Tax=Lebetimonas natsushimae TaxID=1936991 RepID=A0A292YHF1_9BACT|nr:YcaO-like family protein [Lebetimonas natsushimae]GAX88154.1 ribosomal protein S12 methylthiotransferase accessory factor [Lebetimonas natsushimae]